MSRSMNETPHRSRMLRTSRGVASRMSLRHLPTNAGQGRPAEHQRCCGRKPQHRLRCVRSHPTDWGHVCVPGITRRGVRRLPAPVHRLFTSPPPERAQATEPALFIFGHRSSAISMTKTSSIFPKSLPTEHIPNVANKCSDCKEKGNLPIPDRVRQSLP